jgi:hypothetical protein
LKLDIINRDGKYFASLSGFTKTIKKYYIKKSWETTLPEISYFNKDIFNQDVELYGEDIDLLNFYVELEPIPQITNYYTLVLVTEDGLEYPFHIDYVNFYNIENEDDVYRYELDYETYLNLEKKRYDFFLKGIYGDEHKLKLLSVKSNQEVFLLIPKKELLESEVYDIIINENDKRFHRGRFPLKVTDKVDFVLTAHDFGEYNRFTLNPKYNYSIITELAVFHEGKEIRRVTRPSNPFDVIKEIQFFLPNTGFKNPTEIKIVYKLKDNSIYATEVEKESYIYYTPNEKDELEIYDFESEYSHEYDVYKMSWKNKYNKKVVYDVTIGDKIFRTNDSSLSIENFKDFDNNSKEIGVYITCDTVNNLYSYNKYEFKVAVSNYNYIDRSTSFIPQIDYSDVLYCNKPYGTITWTQPKFRHTARVKINTKLIKPFLDEYQKPWINEYILDKSHEEFDKTYSDYDELYQYDFDEDGEVLKTVNDSIISYELEDDDYIITTNGNCFKIPLWFCEDNFKYNISVQIYDYFGELVGENSVDFQMLEIIPKGVTEDILKFNRNQYLQFGETGTIGEFYKIEGATPINVMYNYSPSYKTFLGKELNDITNIDFDGNSMYYYFNTNEGENLTLQYRRNYNFYEFETTVYLGDEVIFPTVIHQPKGNSYEDNIIEFPKKQFDKEGIYTMQIKTFNSTGQSSKVKELNFFVHNTAPEKPFVKIKSADFDEVDGNIIINKKYFEMEVTNNGQSDKYAGWKFKESHFYFRSENNAYNPYPTYVIQTNMNDGSIVLNNTSAIENGEYECKVINYDYAGNASEATIFKFILKSEIKITPQVLFTNELDTKFIWYIEKAQDSDGFYYFFRYSPDGINYTDYPHTKYESPYYVNDPIRNTRSTTLSLNWLKSNNEFAQGFYQLVCYEYNDKHPEGQPSYEFTSPIVDVSKIANPSQPIYAKNVSGVVEVYNRRTYQEWAYTSDLDLIEFNTVHTETILDDPETPEIEGQYYKLELIEPGNTNSYQCTLPQPDEIGTYTFNNIATKCGIETQKEGIWEIRYITIDKNGNSNAYQGYYTYYVNIVKRNPEINNATISNGTGSNYFGLYSDKIGYFVDTSNAYVNIDNYSEHKEKFEVSKFKINFIETPSNTQSDKTVTVDSDGTVKIMESLSESDKVSHTKDGRYHISITAIDPLKRESASISRIFYISTTTDGELNFVNNTTFNSREVELIALASDEVYKIYYVTQDEAMDKPIFDREDSSEDSIWTEVFASNLQLTNQEIYGIQLNELYESDGYKTVYYVIEEHSGNISDVKSYKFKIDTKTMLIPLFDLYNSVYFNMVDDFVTISWESTNQAVTNFKVKLDRVEFNEEGLPEIVRGYSITRGTEGTYVVPVGENKNTYLDIGEDREFSFQLSVNTTVVNGYYMLTVSGENLYGTEEENYFIFEVSYETLTDIGLELTNNKVTIDSNVVSWSHMHNAAYYEVSYDSKTWTKTTSNFFYVNTDSLLEDEDGETYLYMRWKSKQGIYSQVTKINLTLSVVKLTAPTIEFHENNITKNNKILKWKVIVEEPEKANGIYYSFDKEKWYYTKVTGRENWIVNDSVSYPIADGVYDIFAILTDDNPLESDYCNKSDMVHSYAEIFSKEIETPEFLGVQNGQHLSVPTRLFIRNKKSNVQYYILVNGMNVEEGYEISSSSLKRFDIEVKAKKYGIEELYDLISKTDQFHVWSLTTENYILNINNSKILAKVNETNAEIEIESMQDLKTNQVILFREKGKNNNWSVLRSGDTLSLLKEWEFHITTFAVV